ncbi:hypothetical protein [Nostoc favosum]|nr:hypothetical protein [Nostoc favosum]
MGIGDWALGIGQLINSYSFLSSPTSSSPMPHAPCPMPHAQ